MAIAVVTAANPLARAQDTGFNILANDLDHGFKPKITFSDVSSDRIAATRDGADVTYDTAANPRRLAAVVTANLVQFPFTDIAEDMPVAVTFGGFSFEATLGDDNSRPVDKDGTPLPFNPAKKTAIFYFTKDIEPTTSTGTTRTVRIGYVQFSWTTQTVTARVVVSDSVSAGVDGIYDKGDLLNAAAFDADKGGATYFRNEPVPVSITFGSAIGSRTAFGGGLLKTAEVKVGSSARGNDAVLALNTLVAAGGADVTDPKMDTTIPKVDQDGNGIISFNGILTDLAPSSLTAASFPVMLRLFIDDAEVDPAEFTMSVTDPGKAGKSTFTITNVLVAPAGAKVSVLATDASGNSKLVERQVTAGGPTR